MLTDLFSEQELHPVREGVRKYIRLLGLIHDPNPLVWKKWLTDEGELKEALASVVSAFKHTEVMIGKRKYQGVDFNAPQAVKKDMMTFLTSGETAAETSGLKKKFLPMYLLVIEPVVNLFYKFDHPTMIARADEIISGVREMIDNSTDFGTYDDALVAQHQVFEIVRAREEARKQEQIRKNKRRKARDPIAELMASLGMDQEEPEDDEAFV